MSNSSVPSQSTPVASPVAATVVAGVVHQPLEAPAPAAPASVVAAPRAPVAASSPKKAVKKPILPKAKTMAVQAVGRASRAKAPPNGRWSSKVTQIPAMRAIWTEHYTRGVSYEKIEQNPKFDLRHAKGMTAYRICRKYELVTKTKRPKTR